MSEDADQEASSSHPYDTSATRTAFTASVKNRFRPRNEFARVRDAERQLLAWRSIYSQEGLPPIPQDSTAARQTCPDPALAAFAQLCALRTNSRSALISLVGEDSEYVLAEASKTTPLQRSIDEHLIEPLCIGTGTLARSDGIGWHAIEEWRKARRLRDVVPSDHYYLCGLTRHSVVISDLRRESNTADCSYAKRVPWMRFFCSVPLRGAHGSVIGQLAIFDDKPRYGVNGGEMLLLEDLADTIVEHLDSMIIRTQHQMGDRHLQGLTSFISGKRSIREWWMNQDDARVLRKGRYVDRGNTWERSARADVEFGPEKLASQNQPSLIRQDTFTRSGVGGASKHAFGAAPPSTTSDDADTHDDEDDPRPQHQNQQHPSNKEEAEQSDADNPDNHPPSRLLHTQAEETDLEKLQLDMFSRASNLIRETLDANGVAFVSATHVSHTKSKGARSASRGIVAYEGQSSDSNSERTSECEVVGFSVRRAASGDDLDSSAPCPFTISRSSLKRLIKDHPFGDIVHFDESGHAFFSSDDEKSSVSSTDENVAPAAAVAAATASTSTGAAVPSRMTGSKKASFRVLNDAVKGARTMAFLPLWDQNTNHWQSCVFVWNTTMERYFSAELELPYLGTFGQSVAAELAHVRNIASNVAKDTFISSISHELRSPLHGVLASVEFIQDTQMTTFQKQMVEAIESAGNLLLETINHVLDHSKISTSARASKGLPTTLTTTPSQANQNASPTTSIDLAHVTEEVVENCLIAHRARSHMNAAGTPNDEEHSLDLNNDVAVLLHIEPLPHWRVTMQSGAWIRILTNLVGNALKYTRKGNVSIHLQASQQETEAGTPKKLTIHLSIEDTGIGMSKGFLEHSLFTPFKQEDPLSTGTGLGLSIVKRLVDSLGGKLWVKSKRDMGTKIRVRFAIDLAAAADSEASNLDGIDVDNFYLVKDPEDTLYSKVESNILTTAGAWLKCSVSSTPDTIDDDPHSSTICAMTDHELKRLSALDAGEIESILDPIAKRCSSVLVFATSKETLRLTSRHVPDILPFVFVHQPFGPRKLQQIIKAQTGNNASSDSTRSGASQYGGKELPNANPSSAKNSKPPPTSSPSLSDASNDRRSTRAPSSGGLQSAPGSPPSPYDNGLNFQPIGGPASNELNRVMLVEDNSINMKLLVSLMKKLSIAYHCANNGQEALDLYRAHAKSYMLVLMDLSMPIMDGFTATTEIRRFESKGKLPHVRISALTGVTNQESKTHAFNCGVNDFFSKPVQMKELSKLLQQVQQEKRSG